MNKKEIETQILPLVKKPVTYQGNEIGTAHKTITPETIRFAFAFPDLYEVGMSHLGLKILYALMNEQPDVFCERTFAPDVDMAKAMGEHHIPLFALETMDPLTDFDFIGFTLQYEMSFSNILDMLDLAGIPLLSTQREEDSPIIIAGGPCACNPEPLADFIDLFVIGEGEETTLELLSLYRKRKSGDLTKGAFLSQAATIQGIYVPSLYETTYNEDGTIQSITAIDGSGTPHIKKQFVRNMEEVYFPKTFIMPYTDTVHDRITTEIFRGCGRGCRFCQAGMIYRPIREKSVDCIEKGIDTLLKNTGYDEISLSSLSSGDYSHIETLIHDLVESYEDKRVGVSLPSLRIDSLSIEMLEEIQRVRKSGITLAPEAGTQRMRDVINKGVTEANLMDTVGAAFEKGWGHIKLYFMMGLPTETDEDIKGIATLADKVVMTYHNTHSDQKNKALKVVVSTSCFVPKPFTPFQWMGQDTMESFRHKQQLLKDTITNRKVAYNWHDASLSYLEAVFARGDRRLGPVLLRAHELGCRFDGWQEYFNMDRWLQAFEDCGVDPDFYALRTRSMDEVLPWDFIDMGVSKSFLIKEWDQAQEAALTKGCREHCANCGILDFEKGWVCHDHHSL